VIPGGVLDGASYIPLSLSVRIYLKFSIKVIPIDIAVNQLLGLTAAAHHTGSRNPSYPLAIGNNVPIYHVAAGHSSKSIPMKMLNDPNFKLARPYISAKTIIAAYRPMLNKIVDFDNSRTRRVLALPLYQQANGSGKGTNIENGKVEITDKPVDVKMYEVDLDSALKKMGGWTPYLRIVRDIMQESIFLSGA
jgi:hypothetical protein